MKRNLVAGAMLAGSLLFGHGAAQAEDIDLFLQPGNANSGLPNVLILLDNTANWNTAFTNEIAALAQTIDNLPINDDDTARFRLGLMLFTETGSPNSNTDGGYIRAAIRDLTPAYKEDFIDLLNSLARVGDRSNGGKAGKTFSEAYQYFSGFAPFSGNGKLKTDHTGNTTGDAASNAIYALPGNALNSRNGTPYNSPVVDGSCGRNYIIYISNGAAQDNTADNTTANTRLAAAALAAGITGATVPIAISPSGSQTNVADEWSRFMRQSPLGVITYTLDVDKVETGQGPGWSRMLESIAEISEGFYADVSSGNGGAEIAEQMADIFSEIQAVNSVFASVSLPVSVNTQGTFLNQIYVGMFRPDADALPRWYGNLKQYKLGLVGSPAQLRTLDADDDSAINSGTGFIAECARSFWTPEALDTYWSFRPTGNCVIADTRMSNSPDGPVVEKGAQAYRLRATAFDVNGTTRNLQTCNPTFASCTTLVDFDTGYTEITDASLGAADDAEHDAIIDWTRGEDLNNEDGDAVTDLEMRPSSHGDVLHSRPVALNFADADDPPAVVVFYGGNDGVLRAINGSRTETLGGVAAGSEFWSFVGPEFWGQLKRLRDNTTAISFTGAVTPPTRLPKPYGFDGPITAYSDADDKWIFPALRRGGRIVYGFDATNIISPTPGTVSLMWKIGCPNQGDDTGCISDYASMGQAWSAPQNIKTNGYGSGAAPMLIMGGGYDTCEDSDPHSCTGSDKGQHVFVLDAESGGRLRRLPTDRPVAADVTVIPDGTTGLAKYAYAVDTGGNVYRISGATANEPFNATAPSSWTITKIASLGCDSAAATSPSIGCPMNRKFLNPVDVVENSGVYHLLIGSGDREKPLQAFSAAYAVDNHFFMIKDVPADATWLDDETTACGSAIICLDSLVQIASGGADPDAADLATMKGWYLEMRDHEQVVTSSITVFGTTTFSTHTPTVPAAFSCESNLGTARVYNVRFANAGAANGANNRDEEISGGGLPPSPVAGMVELDDGTVVPFIIGADGDSPLEGSLPSAPSTGTQPKSLTYWYIDQ